MYKTIEEIKKELVADAADTCKQDPQYLHHILLEYFNNYDAASLRKMHSDMLEDSHDPWE